MKRIAHIAIAVKDLAASKELFQRLLGIPVSHEEHVQQRGVRTAMFQIGETAVELLEGTNPDSPVSKFIRNKGEGIHHISFAVENVVQEMDRLRNAGFQFVDNQPGPGAGETLVAFLHPRTTNGVLIEISQKRRG
ncbi:MAG: methylmalonyl-CoA epimerase [Bacteroidota bacterium]